MMKYDKPSMEILIFEELDIVTASEAPMGPGGYVDGSGMFG